MRRGRNGIVVDKMFLPLEATDAYGLLLERPLAYPPVSSLPPEEYYARIKSHTERVARDLEAIKSNHERATMARTEVITDQKGRWQVLVMSRKEGETVVIRVAGIEIEVTLVKVKNPRAVRLGFKAPMEAVILREEIIGRDPYHKPKKAKPRS